MKSKIASALFRRDASSSSFGRYGAAASRTLTAQQLSGQPMPLDNQAYRTNAYGLDVNTTATTYDTATSTYTNTSEEEEGETTTASSSFGANKKSSFDRAIQKAIDQGRTGSSSRTTRAAAAPTLPAPRSASRSRKPSAPTRRASNSKTAADEDPFAGTPTFDAAFDSAFGATGITSTTAQAGSAVPARAPPQASSPPMNAPRPVSPSSMILDHVRRGSNNGKNQKNQKRLSVPESNKEPASHWIQAHPYQYHDNQRRFPASSNEAPASHHHQDQPPHQYRNINVAADALGTFQSSWPPSRAEVLAPQREDAVPPPTKHSAAAPNPSPSDEVRVREHSTARDARRERLARERMAAARSSSRSRTIAPDPPSSGDIKRDALNASDDIPDAFFASASPSVDTPNEPPTDNYYSAERHNPEVLPPAVYTRSRSISPRKARLQMAPPTATSSTTAHYVASSRRSQSQGRSSSGTSTSVSSSIDARSRASSRSRSSRRSRRHRSKSRNRSDATAASLASAMVAAEEESQFLDSLANHFPSNAAQMREYVPSTKSLENARMIKGLEDARIMIDRQVQKIRERETNSTSDAAPMHPRRTMPITGLSSRPTASPTAGSWLPAKNDGSYGTSTEAASNVLSEGGRPHYGASMSSMSPLRTLTASEQAYTHGFSLGRNRAMNPFEDEGDDFSAFGAIMSSDGSLSSRRRKGKTPRKLQSSNDLRVRGSPDAVADFQEF